jgi:HlyD family secretion protein
MTRRWVGWVLVIVAVIVAAVAMRLAKSDAIPVDVGSVAKRPVFRSYVTASGEIVATRFADIGSNVMGKIVSLPVREGEMVKAGQLLARIDPVPAQSDVAAAEALVKALEADAKAAAEQVATSRADAEQAAARAQEAALSLGRTRELHTQGLAPKAELDSAQAANDAAEAQVAAARAAIARATQARDAAERRVAQALAQTRRARDLLSKTSIVAPIDGIVSRLQVREGEMVVIGIQNQPGTTLMTISDLSGVNAEVKVAEADVLRVKLGQSARVTLEALPDRPFDGTVVEVGASALPTTGVGAAAREFRVVIRLTRPDPSLRPGLTCDAEILTGERRDVTTVPLQAVVLRNRDEDAANPEAETRGVFTIVAGEARFVPVTTGIIGGLDIEVQGVNEGTPIIVGPYQVLRTLADGTKVRAR